MNDDRSTLRMGIGLALVALALLTVPLLINVVRGGAGGVGVDPRTQGTDLRFAVTYAQSAAEGPITGRLYLVVSRREEPEPRFQPETGATEPYAFVRGVVGWRPGRPIEVTDSDAGRPLPSIAHIPAGYYWVQAVLEPVPTVPGGGAATLMEALGGDWARKSGNLVSRPVEVFIDPRSDDIIRVHLARTVTP